MRLIEAHPNDFITWDLPYKLCDALAAKDASVSEAICQGETDVPFSDGNTTERVRVHLVSPNFFSSLGVHAYLGRVLNADDERTAAPNAVLSYAFWQRRFRNDTSILGRGIILGGHPFTIVGVSPEAFNGLTIETSPGHSGSRRRRSLHRKTIRGYEPGCRSSLWSDIRAPARRGADRASQR